MIRHLVLLVMVMCKAWRFRKKTNFCPVKSVSSRHFIVAITISTIVALRIICPIKVASLKTADVLSKIVTTVGLVVRQIPNIIVLGITEIVVARKITVICNIIIIESKTIVIVVVAAWNKKTVISTIVVILVMLTTIIIVVVHGGSTRR